MSDLISIDHRLYQVVSAYSTVNFDLILAAAQSVQLYEIGASAVFDQNCLCQIVWDPSGSNEMILATHGDIVQTIRKTILGDGAKILRISLINNTSQDQVIGAYALGGFQ